MEYVNFRLTLCVRKTPHEDNQLYVRRNATSHSPHEGLVLKPDGLSPESRAATHQLCDFRQITYLLSASVPLPQGCDEDVTLSTWF